MSAPAGSALLLTHAPPGGASGSAVRAAQTRRSLEDLFERVDVVALARPGDEDRADPGVRLVPRRPVTGRLPQLRAVLEGTGSAFLAPRAAHLEASVDAMLASGALLPRYDLVVPHFAMVAPAALRVPARRRVIDLDMSVAGELARARDEIRSRRGRLLPSADAFVTRREEARLCRRHDLAIVTTEEEADGVRRFHPHVAVVPNTAPDRGRLGGAFAQRSDVLFVGTLDSRANVEAVTFIAERLAPRLRDRVPSARIRVVGRSPTPQVVETCRRAGVDLTADAPSVTDFYARARVVVAPLWSGGGSRIKLLEALSYGSVAVANRVALLGIEVADGVSALVAETPDEFADAIARCFEDPQLCERVATGGRAAYEAHHHPTAVQRRMTALLAAPPRPATGAGG